MFFSFQHFPPFPLRRQLPVGNQSVGGGKIRKNEEGSILKQAEGNSKRRRRKRQKDTFFKHAAGPKGSLTPTKSPESPTVLQTCS